MARNKITAHIIDFNNDVLEFIRLAQPDFAKVMVPQGHNTMKLARAKQLSPNTKWICRLYRDEQPLDAPSYNAEIHARLMAPYKDSYDIFEGYNEPPPYGPDDWKRLNEFEAELARIVHNWGKEYCAFNWSNGQPPHEAWTYLIDATRQADYIGIHSYGWPTLSDCEDLALRHRDLPRLGKPIILTEFGFTELVANPSAEDVGWRTWDIHPWAARQYRCVEELAWMADRLAENDYVLAACYFVTGRLQGDQWRTHDLTPAIYRKIAGYVAQPNNSNGGNNMGIWDNVPSQIKQWKELIGKVTREHPVPIPDHNGVHISPAKLLACMIMKESSGNPRALNVITGATGLMQIMPMHFESGQDPYEPEWNIGAGLKDLERKLYPPNKPPRAFQKALFYYSGRAERSWEVFIERYWNFIVEKYKQFWDIDLEQGTTPASEWEAKYRKLRIRVDEVSGLTTQIQSDLDRIVNDDFRDLSRLVEAIDKLLE